MTRRAAVKVVTTEHSPVLQGACLRNCRQMLLPATPMGEWVEERLLGLCRLPTLPLWDEYPDFSRANALQIVTVRHDASDVFTSRLVCHDPNHEMPEHGVCLLFTGCCCCLSGPFWIGVVSCESSADRKATSDDEDRECARCTVLKI